MRTLDFERLRRLLDIGELPLYTLNSTKNGLDNRVSVKTTPDKIYRRDPSRAYIAFYDMDELDRHCKQKKGKP